MINKPTEIPHRKDYSKHVAILHQRKFLKKQQCHILTTHSQAK